MKNSTYIEVMAELRKEKDRSDRYCTERDKARSELAGRDREINRLKFQIRELEKYTYHLLKELEGAKK